MKPRVYFKIVFPFLMLLAAFSCSDDDPEVKEAVVKVVFTYSGDYAEFEELLGIQVTSENTSSLTVTGTEWDEISHSTDETDVAVWLNQEEYRPLDGQTKTLITSKKVASLTLSGDFQLKEDAETQTASMTATIQLFVDNVLDQTHEVIATENEPTNSFTIPVVVSDPDHVIAN